MENVYIKLFKELCRTTEIMAERVMEYNHQQNDEKAENTAQIMRDDFTQLREKLSTENFELTSLTRDDVAKLLLGILIVTQNIENRIASEQKALNGYKMDLIPKLQRIIDETKEKDDISELLNKLFIESQKIQEEKNS